jgi:hypothetical protein
MNRFILADQPEDCARYMCDSHVIKMILEEAQMLCTYARKKHPQWCAKHPEIYKSTHRNHPATLWLNESGGNVKWAYKLFVCMSKEYEYRYGKRHQTYTKLNQLLYDVAMGEANTAMTEHPQCFGELRNDCESDIPREGYRKYYKHKSRIMRMRWTKRDKPTWMED